jgi:hypothetical protein
MRLVFEKRIDLYKLFLKEEGLTELDKGKERFHTALRLLE